MEQDSALRLEYNLGSSELGQVLRPTNPQLITARPAELCPGQPAGHATHSLYARCTMMMDRTSYDQIRPLLTLIQTELSSALLTGPQPVTSGRRRLDDTAATGRGRGRYLEVGGGVGHHQLVSIIRVCNDINHLTAASG